MVGPWTHSGNVRPYAGDVAFGPDAAITDFYSAFHLRWFDHHLKGAPTGVERDAPVRVFVMGTGDGHRDADGRLFHGGYWRDAQTWPVPGTRMVPYYFHADARCVRAPAQAASSTTFTFDPRHPVPTIGGGSSARLKDGAYDQREDPRFPPSAAPFMPLRSRADVVVFQTEPLAEDMTVIGPISVVLHASSNRTDTDFTAKLIDVYPSSEAWPGGFDLNLTDAIVRGRYRATRDHAVLLTPGRVYPSPSTHSRQPTCSRRGIGSVSTSRAATSRALTSIRTPANRWAAIAGWSRQTIRCTTAHGIRRHIILPLAPARP
ncbi:MAG: CocE/NonD family hydrolase [Aquincola sp.]|nr:CocE/NonD family hydrolase [Aquincola sp.]